MLAASQRALNRWLATLDPDIGQSMATPGVWALVTTNVVVSLAAARYAPGAQAYFQLDVVTSFITFLPALILGLVIGELERRKAVSRATFGVLAIIDVTFFQYFMWAVVALSRLPGAPLMAVFPVLLASFHGQLLRCTPSQPYVALGVALGGGAAFAFHGLPEHTPIFAVAVPSAIGTAFVVGNIGLNNHRERLHALALREAIDAQVLSESMDQAISTRNLLMRVQTQQHDAGNALSGVLISAEQLALAAAQSDQASELRASASNLLSGLERLRKYFDATRRSARSAGQLVEVVDVEHALRHVASELSTAHPEVRLELAPKDAGLEHLALPISGGEAVFQRVITNLMLNACQGDGTRRATEVMISMRISEDRGSIEICIEDNGPGLPAEALAKPLRAFHTTKAHGSGLGLYTCDRLLRASGGRLEIGNRATGPGALARVVLPSERLA